MVFKGPQDLAASELEDLHGPEDEDSEAGAEARQSRVRDALVRQAHLDALFTVCAIMYRLARDGAVGAPMYLDTAAVAVTLSVFFLSRERYVNGVYSYVAVRSVTLVGVRSRTLRAATSRRSDGFDARDPVSGVCCNFAAQIYRPVTRLLPHEAVTVSSTSLLNVLASLPLLRRSPR